MQIRNKKQFLSTVATTVVSALLVAGAVMGATTLSTNIETGGNLTVSGTAAITGATALTGATTVTGALYANGGLDRSTAAALTIGGTNATSVAIGGAVTTGNIAIGSIQTTGLLTLGKITEEAIQIGGYSGGGADLYSIILAPKASVATTAITRHKLVQIVDPAGGSLFGDVGHPTYGLAASFDRSVATTSDIGGVDTGFDLRVANDVANNAAYDIQGAYIKVTNSEDSAASTVDVMKGLFVEALNETTATAGTVIGIDIGINSDGSETTATGLNIRNSGVNTFTDIKLQNGETIDNTTNGIVTVGGDLAINGARINDGATGGSGDFVESFLLVEGDITGLGNGAYKAPTYGVKVSMSRDLGVNVAVAGTSESAIKVDITNKAVGGQAATYVLRGMDINAKSRDTGVAGQIYGASITGESRSGTTVTDLYGAQISVAQGATTHTGNTVGLFIQDQSQAVDAARNYGLMIDTSAYAITRGYGIYLNSGAGSWTNGLSFDGTVTNVLDFADTDGTNGALVAATTITTPESSAAIIRIDINGTAYYIPAYVAGEVNTAF